ncbi:MAG: heavy metal translocating P-type ATPase metal-binding domain-containing protein, partial [Pseudomonadota bacterium]
MTEPARWRSSVLGAPREFCCAGCQAVASTIAAAGFERYYETRSATACTPVELLPASELDDPLAQAQFVASAGEHGREATLILDRIRCAACLWLIEQWLRRQPGVLRASVNYATRRALVAWDERRAKLSQLVAAVRAIGYDAYPWDPQRQALLERDERRKALWRLFVAGFGAMQVMMYAFPAYLDPGGALPRDVEALFHWASLALTLPVLVFSCAPFFAAAWQDARHRRVSLDTPIALGIGAGFAASAWATVSGSGAVYFDSIAMLVFLLLGARYLEMSARQRAARALERLARWMPAFALRLAGEDAHKVAAHQLAPGDRVLVPAGDRVPADGMVERGASSADESLLTGESRPVAKRAGEALVGGSVNLEQPLVMRVTRAGAETQAAAIARLVERAAAAKPPSVASADRLAHALTWIVLVVAAAGALYWRDPWIAVAVLVATCPCALALATPVALTAASARLLGHGVALTRARALETLERATDVLLDKTGTLTEGRFALAHAAPLGSLDAQACLRLAARLE